MDARRDLGSEVLEGWRLAAALLIRFSCLRRCTQRTAGLGWVYTFWEAYRNPYDVARHYHPFALQGELFRP
jgi:hypothetical protein